MTTAMTTNPAESAPHASETPPAPEPEVTDPAMPGVDPDWPQTAAPAPDGSDEG